MSKFCNECGTAAEEEDKFCSKCGANLRKTTEDSKGGSSIPPQRLVELKIEVTKSRIAEYKKASTHGWLAGGFFFFMGFVGFNLLSLLFGLPRPYTRSWSDWVLIILGVFLIIYAIAVSLYSVILEERLVKGEI